MESEALMGEVIGRLMIILTGFVLSLLGVIVFIHSNDHALLGVLISFSGVCAIFGGLPYYE